MNLLQKTYWVLRTQIGIDPLTFWRSLKAFPAFLGDYSKFVAAYKGDIGFMPCLQDRNDDCGSINNEYFWQDILVARMVLEKKPTRHLDIGSRIDGFVAHVAASQDIEVLDIRPNSYCIPGVIFRQADLTAPIAEVQETYDSISCLHALEHFGLGRYGDEISANGFRQGFANMAKLLKSQGVFYLSVPLGRERVEFNANWVFSPDTILELAKQNDLSFNKLQTLKISNNSCDIKDFFQLPLPELEKEEYRLGIFQFTKL